MCILPIFLCGSEIWCLTSTLEKKIDALDNGVSEASSISIGRILSSMMWFGHVRDNRSCRGHRGLTEGILSLASSCLGTCGGWAAGSRAGGRTPRTARSGGPHACSGASCCVGEPFWAHQYAKNLLVAGAPPRTPLGELQALPQTP